jgi:hypothetical protein
MRPSKVGHGWLSRRLRVGIKSEAGDDSAALCDENLFAGLQQFFNFWEGVAQIADRDGLHQSHFSSAMNLPSILPGASNLSWKLLNPKIFVFYSPFHAELGYAGFRNSEVALWIFKKN